MELLMPITVNLNKEKYILIREDNRKFICSYCENVTSCNYLDDLNNLKPVICCDTKDSGFIELQLKVILDEIKNHSNLIGIIYLIGEDSLVTYRKSLYKLSKSIFNLNKHLTQSLFTNVEFKDLLKLTSAYKYLTYIDYIIRNEHIDYENTDTYMDCIFNNLTYIDLTKSFSIGKVVYKNS